MTKEEKQLVFVDLCARLPYGVKVYSDGIPYEQTLIGFIPDIQHYNIKAYLRPMLTMTEEEQKEYNATMRQEYMEVYPNSAVDTHYYEQFSTYKTFDWLNKNMFDYRGLIPMGLALEAPKEMYKTQ